jgi:tetratricopeptide (TPR) repeat protein
MKNIFRNLISLKYLLLILVLAAPIVINAQENTAKNKIDQLLYNGKYNEVLPIIYSEIAKDSLDPDLYYKAGTAEQGLYKHDNAIASFNKAILLNDKNISYYLSIGKSYSTLGLNEESVSAYHKAYEIDPANMNAAFPLIGALISDNQFEDAIDITSKMIQRDSTVSLLYSQLAYCFMKIDSLKLAANYYRKAYELNSSNLNSMQQLIVLYIKLGNNDQASKLIEYGLQRYAKLSVFPKLKADLLYKTKKYDDAIINYTKAVAMGDSSLSNLQKLGLSYYFYVTTNDSLPYNMKVKFFRKAKTALQKAYEKDKENPFICFYLGVMKARVGEFDDAIGIFEDALDLSIASFAHEIYNYMGDCYRIERNYESAVDAYKLALALKPDNMTVINNLHTIYIDNIKDQKALLRFYEEFLSRNRDIDINLRSEINKKIEQMADKPIKPGNKN